MKHISRKLGALLLIAACFAGCGIRQLPTAEDIAQRLPEYEADLETLRRGRSLVVTSCSACHRLFFPSEYRPGAWHKITSNMGSRMFMGPKTTAVIREYLTAASTHSLRAP